MLRRFISSWEQEKPAVEYIGGRHWAFIAAEQELAVEERLEAEAERLKRKEALRSQHKEREEAEMAAAAAAAEAEKQEALLAEAAKREKKKEKKELQKERARLRALSADIGATDQEVEKLCNFLELPELRERCERLESCKGDSAASQAIIKAAVTEIDEEAARRKVELEERLWNYNSAARPDSKDPWSEEELRMLQKALVKFPQGTARRWEQMASFLGTRKVEEVVEMVKVHMAAGNTDLQRQNQGLQIAKKRQVNLNIQDQATMRREVLTDVQLNLKGEAAVVFDGDETSAGPSQSEEGLAWNTVRPSESGTWSEVQELALVKALKVFGKEYAQERWVRVAEAVPGKNKAECFLRFKQIRQQYRVAKGTQD
mmetsp:Transcript_33778/g.95588  ORF Transcript_33778/g.95588 Transcript_33778/m.95588 type:complete len:372 (-) Transcript_33778:1188-2303(-)